MESLTDTPRRAAYLALVAASEHLVAQFKKLFQQHGLTLTQFNLLRLLVKDDALELGESCTNLRDRMLHRVPDITRLVDRMERDGLVLRRRSELDRRVVRVFITPEGRRRCEALYPAVRALHEQQFAGLDDRELQELERMLSLAAESK